MSKRERLVVEVPGDFGAIVRLREDNRKPEYSAFPEDAQCPDDSPGWVRAFSHQALEAAKELRGRVYVDDEPTEVAA